MEWLASSFGLAGAKEERCPVCAEETSGGTHRCKALEQKMTADQKSQQLRSKRQPARSAAPPQCSGSHEMAPSRFADGMYAGGFLCNSCGMLLQGERWYCSVCSEDLCYGCWPPTAADGEARRVKRKSKRRSEDFEATAAAAAAAPPVAAPSRPKPAQPTAEPASGLSWQQQREQREQERLRDRARDRDQANHDGGDCPAHRGQRLTLFCMMLRTPLCVKCLHQGRTPSGEPLDGAVWLPFDDAAADVRSFVSQQAAVLRTRRAALSERLRDHTDAADAARRGVEQAADRVRAHFREVTAAAQRREQALLGQLTSFLQAFEKEALATRSELDKAMLGLESSMTVADDVASGKISSRDLLVSFETIGRSLSVEASAPMPLPPPPCHCDVVFQPALREAVTALSQLGSVSVSLGEEEEQPPLATQIVQQVQAAAVAQPAAQTAPVPAAATPAAPAVPAAAPAVADAVNPASAPAPAAAPEADGPSASALEWQRQREQMRAAAIKEEVSKKAGPSPAGGGSPPPAVTAALRQPSELPGFDKDVVAPPPPAPPRSLSPPQPAEASR